MKSREATAKRYAKALLDVAREGNAIEAVGRDLEAFVGVFGAEASLQGVLLRPWIKPAERQAVAREVAQRAGLGKLVQDFVALVAARGRADHLPEMATAYRALVDEALGRATGEVRTAVPMTEDEKRRLSARLGRALGKDVVLEEVVDRSLLGGFVARVGSFVLDGSLDGQLRRLHERLARG
jgi:F-type H+-transporting ATPase subunit delta